MQVATTFLRAVVSGDSERALRMVGDDAPLYAEALPALARDAKRKHLRVVRFQRLGDGRFRYWNVEWPAHRDDRAVGSPARRR